MQWEPTIYLVLLLVLSLGVYWYATRRGIALLRWLSGYCAAFIAVYWSAGAGAGPAEFSDLWRYFEFGLIPLASATVCGYCSRIASPWLRVPIVFSTGIVALLTGLFLLALLLMQSLDVRRELPIYSPDGRHAAIVRLEVTDGLDPGSATVAVRRTWSPNAIIAYVGWAYLAQAPRQVSPKVTWIDSSRLLIQHIAHPPDRSYSCASKVGEITILCESARSQ